MSIPLIRSGRVHQMTPARERAAASSRRAPRCEERRSRSLSAQVGITLANLSILETGEARAIPVLDLEAICEALDCQPADLLTWEPGG